MAAGKLEKVETRHILDLIENISPADRREIEAFGYSAADGILTSVEGSIECFAWTVDGRVACLFGVAPSFNVLGPVFPWMLSTPLLRRHWRFFARSSRKIAEAWKERFPHMKNYVDARHTIAVNWIKWLGFEVSRDTIEVGPDRIKFYTFEARRELP